MDDNSISQISKSQVYEPFELSMLSQIDFRRRLSHNDSLQKKQFGKRLSQINESLSDDVSSSCSRERSKT